MIEPDRQTVADAIGQRFADDKLTPPATVLREMRWDALSGCWMFFWRGMWLGIEPDGYVHS